MSQVKKKKKKQGSPLVLERNNRTCNDIGSRLYGVCQRQTDSVSPPRSKCRPLQRRRNLHNRLPLQGIYTNDQVFIHTLRYSIAGTQNPNTQVRPGLMTVVASSHQGHRCSFPCPLSSFFLATDKLDPDMRKKIAKGCSSKIFFRSSFNHVPNNHLSPSNPKCPSSKKIISRRIHPRLAGLEHNREYRLFEGRCC